MQNALATVTLEHVSGFPEDNVTNTFAFRTAGVASAEAEAANLAGILPAFYNAIGSGSGALASWLTPGLKRTANGAIIRVYNLDGKLQIDPATGKVPPHGSPILESAFTLGGGAIPNSPQPEEVALVMTLRGQGWSLLPIEMPDGSDPGSAIDRPRQRASGRLYIGPFNATAIAAVSSKARPAGSLVTAMLDAAEKLYDDAELLGHAWGVWSRANGEITPLSEAQVDDAFDTQRRRGVAPNTRTTRVLEP